MSKRLMFLGNNPNSGYAVSHSYRNPSLHSQEALQAFCKAKTVKHVWADMSTSDAGQTILTFFDDGSVLQMHFVQERHWSDTTWDNAEVHWCGYLSDELEAL